MRTNVTAHGSLPPYFLRPTRWSGHDLMAGALPEHLVEERIGNAPVPAVPTLEPVKVKVLPGPEGTVGIGQSPAKHFIPLRDNEGIP